MKVQRAEDVSVLEKVFEFRTPAAVRECLDGHSDIVALLSQVPRRAKQYFGDDARFVLEVRPDRDGSGPAELFAYVVTHLSAEEAWKQMVRLEETWWSDAVGDEPVNLQVEFV